MFRCTNRMFTSRAEYRISLRADNADLRLTRKGVEFGLVQDEERMSALDAREFLVEDRINKLRDFKLKVTEWSSRGGNDLMGGAQSSRKPGNRKSAEEVLIMPHVTLKAVEDIMMEVSNQPSSPDESSLDGMDNNEVKEPATFSPPSVYDTVEASIKYQSYVRRQYKDMESWRRAQGKRIPPDVVYDHSALPTLSLEELEKLNINRPNTFAEASQISGVTTQSIVYLYHHVQRRNKQRDGRSARPQTQQSIQ
jgi:tRNA uridine 5-carboxymethylaminomethyl modification enzyme